MNNNDLKKVGLVFKSDGTTDFIKSLNMINGSLQENYSRFKLVQTLWDNSTKTSDKLKDKLEYLNNAYDIQTDKVNLLVKELEELESAEVRDEKAIQKKKTQLNQAEAKLNSYKKQIQETTAMLKTGTVNLVEYGKSVEDAGKLIENAGKKVQKFSLVATAGLTASLKTAIDFEDAFAGVAKTVDATDEELAELRKGIQKMSTELPASTTEISAVAEAAGVKMEETDYFGKNNVPAALNFPNVTSAIFESDIANGGANSEPLTVGENEFVVVRVVDHKDEGLQSLDEAKSTIEQFLKREKADKVLAEKAEQAVKALSTDPTKLPAGISFSEPQTFTLMDNKDPMLYEGVFAIAKPQDGKVAYQVARNSKGDVVVVALERVEEPTLSEQELEKFSTQLVLARQGELQGQLMQALREKAQIEINNTFINQDDSEEGASH